MPILSIGGDKSLGDALGQQAKLVGTDVTVIVLKETGHWILEEQPKETTDALKKFLQGSKGSKLYPNENGLGSTL